MQAGPGQALVIAQRLEPTQQVLAKLGIALPVVGGIGVLVARWPGSRWPAPGCVRWTG